MCSEKKPRIYGKYASNDQKEAIIDHLEKNLPLARNQFTSADGKNSLASQWDHVALKLNSIGGANKNGIQWKKFWDDLKLRVKQKYSEIKKRLNKSGVNGLDPIPELTDLEQRIINIMTIDAVDGDTITQEFGFINDIPPSSRQADNIEMSYDIETCSNTNIETNIETSLRNKKGKRNLVRENKEDKFYAEVIILKKKKIELEQDKIKLMKEDISLKKEIIVLLKDLQSRTPINLENLEPEVEYLESD